MSELSIVVGENIEFVTYSSEDRSLGWKIKTWQYIGSYSSALDNLDFCCPPPPKQRCSL